MALPGSLHRYSRQVVLNEIGVSGQMQLRESCVVVNGVGGLGCAAAQYLAAAGIGRLRLIDGDRIDVTNLHRQILFGVEDLGRPKAEVAATALTRLNPETLAEAVVAHGDPAHWPQWIADADVVLDCTDNFPARFALNAACVAAHKPLVVGAALRWEGQAVVFDLRRGGPCYACLFPEQGGDDERCETAGVLGPVAGIIGVLQAHFALKLLAGVALQTGVLHLWDARGDDWRRVRVSADPSCPICAHR